MFTFGSPAKLRPVPPANNAYFPTDVAVKKLVLSESVAVDHWFVVALKISTVLVGPLIVLPPAKKARLPTEVAARLARGEESSAVVCISVGF